MGLFSSLLGGKAPSYDAPQAQTYQTGEQGFSRAQDWLKQNGYSNQLGAQATALGQLATPESTQAYYSSFQPTSFEQALANQSFQNVWPDTQAYMQNQLAKSGMAYSPVAAATLGKEYGNLSQSIGQYLNEQANNRANTALQANLSVNPMSYLQPVSGTILDQANMQNNANYSAALNKAQADYANSMAAYQSKMNQIDAIGGIGMMALGGAAGGMGALGGAGGISGALTGMNMGGSLASGNIGGAIGSYNQYSNPNSYYGFNNLGGYSGNTTSNPYSMTAGYNNSIGSYGNTTSLPVFGR